MKIFFLNKLLNIDKKLQNKNKLIFIIILLGPQQSQSCIEVRTKSIAMQNPALKLNGVTDCQGSFEQSPQSPNETPMGKNPPPKFIDMGLHITGNKLYAVKNAASVNTGKEQASKDHQQKQGRRPQSILEEEIASDTAQKKRKNPDLVHGADDQQHAHQGDSLKQTKKSQQRATPEDRLTQQDNVSMQTQEGARDSGLAWKNRFAKHHANTFDRDRKSKEATGTSKKEERPISDSSKFYNTTKFIVSTPQRQQLRNNSTAEAAVENHSKGFNSSTDSGIHKNTSYKLQKFVSPQQVAQQAIKLQDYEQNKQQYQGYQNKSLTGSKHQDRKFILPPLSGNQLNYAQPSDQMPTNSSSWNEQAMNKNNTNCPSQKIKQEFIHVSGLSRSSDPVSEQSQVKVKGGDFLSKISQQFSETNQKAQDSGLQYNLLPIYRQSDIMAVKDPKKSVKDQASSNALTQSPMNSKLLTEQKPAEEVKEKKKKTQKNKKKDRTPKLIINTFNTQYDVIMKAASDLGFIEKKVEPLFYATANPKNDYLHHNAHFNLKASDLNFNHTMNLHPGLNANQMIQQAAQIAAQQQPQSCSIEEFDIFWYDLAIPLDILHKVKPYQRISQWPGIQVVAHKNRLGQNLMIMRKEFPDDYDFFPVTYVLPHELALFRSQFSKKDDQAQRQDQDGDARAQQRRQKQKSNVDQGDSKNINNNQNTNNNQEDEKVAGSPEKEGSKVLKKKKAEQPPQKPEQPKIFIVKPECESQGKGIYLTSTWEDVNAHDHVVAQHYIDPPYLLRGLKFDLRIYVLLYGINPMKIYLFEDGLARFATEHYQSPKPGNMKEVYMHLTNYAINKQNDKYVQNKDERGTGDGHKKSLKQIYADIARKEGPEHGPQKVKVLKEQIKDIIIKTLITGQPTMWHIYRSCQPEDVENSLCFQILGFDIMLDQNLKPWLIEVNHAPSLATESAFDLTLKLQLVGDTIRLLNLSHHRRLEYINRQKKNFQQRILTGKTQKLTPEQKEEKRREYNVIRDEKEKDLRGGFELIYPLSDSPADAERRKLYQSFLSSAQDQYEFFNSHKRKNGTLDPTQHYERRYIKSTNARDEHKRPAWGQGGKDPSSLQSEKVSKYKANLLVKARVDTGLNSQLKKNHHTISSRSLANTGANDEEKDAEQPLKEINLKDLLDPSKHTVIEYVQIIDQNGNLNTISRDQLISLVQKNPDLLKNTLQSHPEKIPIEEMTTHGYFNDQIKPIREERSRESRCETKAPSPTQTQQAKASAAPAPAGLGKDKVQQQFDGLMSAIGFKNRFPHSPSKTGLAKNDQLNLTLSPSQRKQMIGSPRFVIKHTKHNSHFLDPAMACLQGTSLNTFMHRKRASEQSLKPQNHVVLQARITAPQSKLFSMEPSPMHSIGREKEIDSVMLTEAARHQGTMRRPDRPDGISKDKEGKSHENRTRTINKKKQVFFTNYGADGEHRLHITTDEAESGAADTLFQKYQRAERRRLITNTDMTLQGNQISKGGAGSGVENKDGHMHEATMFRGPRHVMAEVSNGGQAQRAAQARTGLKEAPRELPSTMKPQNDQVAARIHPSSIRLSVVGKNQLQPTNEQGQAHGAANNTSTEGVRGPLPKPFDRRRSDLPASPSLVQMIQQNQRTLEAQVMMMKSNSNSILPCLPTGVYTYNSSLNLTPDASNHIKADQSQKRVLPGEDISSLKQMKQKARQLHAQSNTNQGAQQSGQKTRNGGHQMPPIIQGDKVVHSGVTKKTDAAISTTKKKEQIARTTNALVGNPKRISIAPGEGRQTFLTAHLIRFVQQRHHSMNSALDDGPASGMQAQYPAGEPSHQLHGTASTTQLQQQRSSSHQVQPSQISSILNKNKR